MVQRVTISLPETLVHRTKAYASKRGPSFSGLVRVSLEKIMEHDENAEQ